MNSEGLTQDFLNWLNVYLTHDADLTVERLRDRFTDPFSIRINGTFHDRFPLEQHLANLNLYRKDIIKINYRLIEGYYKLNSSVSVLSLKVVREHRTLFTDTILRLRFNENGLIDSWHQLFSVLEPK